MSETKNIIDFKGKRDKMVERKRRAFERVMFDNICGCYTVIEKGGVFPVSLVDISHDGCLFQVPLNGGTMAKFRAGDEIDLRFYFTKQSYLPVTVNIRHNHEYVDPQGNVFMRFGCEFDKTTHSFDALNSFIKFIYKFAEHSCIDKGDTKVFFL